MFVVVCGSGAIYTSTDAIAWTLQDSTTTGALAAVTWGGGQFVAVGGIGTAQVGGHMGMGVIVTSPDGITWTSRETNSEIGDTIVSILYADGQFIAGGSAVDIFGDHDPTPLFLSSDGVTWTRHLLAAGPGPAVIGLAWNGSRYVAVGGGGTISGDPRTIATSTDALTWQFVSLPAALNEDGLTAVAWTGRQFVTVGGFGEALTSPDGLEWTNDFTGSSAFFTALALGHDVCVAGGVFGAIMVDTDCAADAGDTIFASGFDP
jgi:hypothetical protein